MLARRTSEANTVVCGSSPNGNSRKWTDLFTVTFTKHSSHVRESKTVLDSGFHVTYSGFRVLNSSLFSVKSLSFIPDFRFHNHKFSWFRNLDSLTWGWKPVFLNSQTNYVFAASSSYGHLSSLPEGARLREHLLWFNFILDSNFIFLNCFKLIIIYYHTQEHREIKFKPRTKLNHNTSTACCLLIRRPQNARHRPAHGFVVSFRSL